MPKVCTDNDTEEYTQVYITITLSIHLIKRPGQQGFHRLGNMNFLKSPKTGRGIGGHLPIPKGTFHNILWAFRVDHMVSLISQ